MGKLRDFTSRHRVKEYAQGAQLFFAIQTEANKNVPATMWKRIANQADVKLSEIPEQPLLPSTDGSEHLGW